MKYKKIRPDHEAASYTDQRPDPAEILVDDDQGNDQEDLAWSIAAAYSWASEEQEEES